MSNYFSSFFSISVLYYLIKSLCFIAKFTDRYSILPFLILLDRLLPPNTDWQSMRSSISQAIL